jgi:hypothetical protein
VILRMEFGGGLVPMEFFATQMPQFTLYGDGTAVFRPLPDADGTSYNEPYPPLLMAHLSETQIQELLHYALYDGGLATAKDHYDDLTIADAGTTNFTIRAGDVDKAVSVYALMESGATGADQADRNAMGKLQQRLRAFETEARAAGEVADYDAEAYKVTLYDEPTWSPAEGVTVIEWPWNDVQPSDFTANSTGLGATKVLSRDYVAKLTTVPNGGQTAIWAKTKNGTLFEFALRPLLREEIATDPVGIPDLPVR